MRNVQCTVYIPVCPYANTVQLYPCITCPIRGSTTDLHKHYKKVCLIILEIHSILPSPLITILTIFPNLKTKPKTFQWFSRVPRSKFEANRSKGSWVMIGHANKYRLLLKGTVKEKWKGWKLITLALDRDPWKLYLMRLSREIDIKLC